MQTYFIIEIQMIYQVSSHQKRDIFTRENNTVTMVT